MNTCTVPVLFITFARPGYARVVFNKILQAKPRKLYFYSNKAVPDDVEQLAANDHVRSFVREINWECELHLFFRESHVDVYTSVLSALDWVFDNEEEAIILEEDCVPSLAFFDYCRQLLPIYKDDIRVWLISGDNFFPNYNPSGYDYIFSRYAYQWGWATWRSRWCQVRKEDILFKEMKEYKLYNQLFPGREEAQKRLEIDERAFAWIQNKPCWDYLFGFTVKSHGGFGIVPVENLVSNIGTQGHHSSQENRLTNNKEILLHSNYEILNHPPFVVPDYRYDRYFFRHFRMGYRHRLTCKVERLLKKAGLLFMTVVKRYVNQK